MKFIAFLKLSNTNELLSLCTLIVSCCQTTTLLKINQTRQLFPLITNPRPWNSKELVNLFERILFKVTYEVVVLDELIGIEK